MKNVLAIALLAGVTTLASAREPILVPAAPSPALAGGPGVAYQYSPTPVRALGAPSQAGGIVVEDDDVLYPVPTGSQTGRVICDACDAHLHGVPLFHNVKVIQARKIHPHAVPKIVAVPDPCAPPCDACFGEQRYVFIEICVPPCACEEICMNRRGNRIKFDYGKYAVKVTVRHGRLIVNYDR